MSPAGSKLDKAQLLYDAGNGWCMYSWSMGIQQIARDNLTGNESFLTHRCGSEAGVVSEVYIFPDTHKNCWRCTEPVPDGIRALWILHNGAI